MDLSVAQEFYIKIAGKKNRIQVRADILNFGNLVNSDWGVGNVLTSDRPISFTRVTADGTPVYGVSCDMDGFAPKRGPDGDFTCEIAFDGHGLQARVGAPGASVGQSVTADPGGHGALMQFGSLAGNGFAASNTLQLQMMTTAMPTLSLQQVGIQQALLALGGLPH